jgi:hypothetical protein
MFHSTIIVHFSLSLSLFQTNHLKSAAAAGNDRRMLLRRRLDTLRSNLMQKDVLWKPKKKTVMMMMMKPHDDGGQRKYTKYDIPTKLNVVVDVARGLNFDDIVEKHALNNRKTVYFIIDWFRNRECEQAAAMDLLEFIADSTTLPKGTPLTFDTGGDDASSKCSSSSSSSSRKVHGRCCKEHPNKVSHLKKMCFKKQKGVCLSDTVAFLLGATSSQNKEV